ncbi:MAG: UbiA-like polyprenyltransferase [Chitinophagaceae bacterium]
MSKVRNYLSLIKFSHTIFAMPFALIGFLIPASSLIKMFLEYRTKDLPCFPAKDTHVTRIIEFDFNSPLSFTELFVRFGLIILCMIFARSAAMAFNRYLDRKFDAKNPRTAVREIPAGIIKANSVLWFTIASCLLFIVCCFFINKLCFYLSPVALAVVLGYSYTKRFTPLCHLILGLGLSLAPIGAYLAVTGQFALLPILFSMTVLFWVSGFDIIYALQDVEFDKSQQLYSIPVWLGKTKALRISELLHLLSAAAIVFAGWYGNFGWIYWTGAALFTGLLVYQHSIVRPTDLKRVNIAFMTSNGIASVVFSIFVIIDLLLGQ